ncbi:MAG: hypothetical protein QW328_06880 [Nitrososphaerota archaeon]
MLYKEEKAYNHYIPKDVAATSSDFFSASWPKLKEYILGQIELLRDRLEGAASFDEVKEIQGQIKAFRKLLFLEKEAILYLSSSSK